MYYRSVLLTCSAFALCAGLGITSVWAMERDEGVDRVRVLSRERADIDQIAQSDPQNEKLIQRANYIAEVKEILTLSNSEEILSNLIYNEELDWELRIIAACSSSNKEAILTTWANDKKLDFNMRLIAARHLPNKKDAIATFTSWTNDTELDWEKRILAACELPDEGKELLTGWALTGRTNNNETLDWETRMSAALNLPDSGVEILTDWANNLLLSWERRLTAVRNLPDEGVELLTSWANDGTRRWGDRLRAAVHLPDEGVDCLTAWANDTELDWQTRINAALNLPNNGLAILTAWAKDKSPDFKKLIEAVRILPDEGVEILTAFATNKNLDWQARLIAARNLPDKGVKLLIAWANDPKCCPELRLEGIPKLDDQYSQNRLYREIFSDKDISLDCRLIAYRRININNCTHPQRTLIGKTLGKILQEPTFFDTIKNLTEENQKDLLETILNQKDLNKQDKEKIQAALTALKPARNINIKMPLFIEHLLDSLDGEDRKRYQDMEKELTEQGVNFIKTSSSNNNNNSSVSTSTSTSTAKSSNSSKGPSLIGKLLAASRMPTAAPAAQSSKPPAGSSNNNSKVKISKGKEEVDPPVESKKEKKSKKKKKSSQPLVEQQSTAEELSKEKKEREEKEKRIRAAMEKEERNKKEDRLKRHAAKTRSNNNSDVSSEDETSTSTSSRTSTDDSSSDVENDDSDIKVKRKEVTALIRRAAVREVVDAQKMGQMPNALEFVQRVLSQTMPGVAPVIVQKFVQTADHALKKAKRVFGSSNNNNNNASMEKEEESYTVRSAKTFDISSCTFHSPDAALKKYKELVEAFKKTLVPTSDVEKLNKKVTVTINGETVLCDLHSARLSNADRLVYIVVKREIICLFAGDHKAYERYIANTNNIILDFDDDSDEARESNREAME